MRDVDEDSGSPLSDEGWRMDLDRLIVHLFVSFLFARLAYASAGLLSLVRCIRPSLCPTFGNRTLLPHPNKGISKTGPPPS